MQRLNLSFVLLVLCCWMSAAPVLGQAALPVDSSPAKPEERSARSFFEEAEGYLHRRYQEFNKQKLPFDPKLESKVKQEQRDLATKNAATLEVRGPLNTDELYYVGRLYHLAGNSAKAYEWMQRFLGEGGSGENAQVARAVIVVHALKSDRLSEAETVTETYSKNEPVNLQELYGLENLLANEYLRLKKYDRMAVYAEAMMKTAKLAGEKKAVENFKRDEMLFKAASLLAEAQLRLNKREVAIATLENLRRTAIGLPSANLYKLAKMRLIGLDPAAGLGKPLETDPGPTLAAPELIVDNWIDQEPKKLDQFRGQVVLLDFWAPWCGPCRYTLPHLQKLHESYKDKGLVVLGLTTYSGHAEGKQLTEAEELEYLRTFKTRNRLSYGFAVTDGSENDLNYGVSSIPISFLIDRRGSLRFISVGANEMELAALDRMVKRLIDESEKKNDSVTAKRAN